MIGVFEDELGWANTRMTVVFSFTPPKADKEVKMTAAVKRIMEQAAEFSNHIPISQRGEYYANMAYCLLSGAGIVIRDSWDEAGPIKMSITQEESYTSLMTME
jgi:hypothetical protein